MRDLKFRCWDNKKKRFGYCGIDTNRIYWPTNLWISHKEGDCEVRFDDVTAWEQITNQKDINDEPVCEGDIVKCMIREDKKYDWRIGVISFDRDYCSLAVEIKGNSWNYLQVRELEVIGNIHETPQLLQSQSQKERPNL